MTANMVFLIHASYMSFEVENSTKTDEKCFSTFKFNKFTIGNATLAQISFFLGSKLQSNMTNLNFRKHFLGISHSAEVFQQLAKFKKKCVKIS